MHEIVLGRSGERQAIRGSSRPLSFGRGAGRGLGRAVDRRPRGVLGLRGEELAE